MFGKMKRKENINRGNNEKRANQKVEKEITESVIKPFDNDTKDGAIRPIIFTSVGSCRDRGLSDFPLTFSKSANLYVAANGDKLLDPIVEKRLLKNLDGNNNIIAVSNLTNYILQNSFMSICSALNSSKYVCYFNTIPVLPYIQEELFGDEFTNTIRCILCDLAFHNYNTTNMDTGFYEDFLNQSIAYAENISMQISQMICTSICRGAEKAITEVGMHVHMSLGIDDLHRKLIYDFEHLKSVKNEMPQDFDTHCTILLKQLFAEIVECTMFTSINRDIKEILVNSIIGTFYFVYNDYLYYDFDAAREQLLMEAKRQKKINNNDIL